MAYRRASSALQISTRGKWQGRGQGLKSMMRAVERWLHRPFFCREGVDRRAQGPGRRRMRASRPPPSRADAGAVKAAPGQLRAAPPCSLQGQPFGLVWALRVCPPVRRQAFARLPSLGRLRPGSHAPLSRERPSRSTARRQALPPSRHICRAKRGGHQALPARVSARVLPGPQAVPCLSFSAQP